ncbi:MAG: single-stranded-DNA-specific exonuclease RecJ [Acidobacteriota bacterium]
MTIVDEILRSRGLATKAAREAFLSPDYDAMRHDPFLLPDMQNAVERLVLAKERGEKVVIYGDYDIDGLTASTVLVDSFEKFGIEASVFIPNRFVEGYGLNGPALETLAEHGAQLIVTVDCGSLSHAEVELANTLGMEVIVTDHHAVGETLPPAVAVINPKRLLKDFPERYDGFVLRDQAAGSELRLYPFVDLAGVGVAFKLVQALQTRLEGLPAGQEKWLLDLVAFGTVCDVVQLVDENRANVYWGLQVMQKTRRVGLKMLMAVTKIDPQTVTARTLGFVFGPRLNASGRLETAQVALDLLTVTDRKQALALAETLDAMNAERRAEQDRIFVAASAQAQTFDADRVLVVSDPSWSHGIIGIVAAKLLETYRKPTFVLQELPDGTAKGSARSFGDFSAVEGIRATDQHLIKGGGHKLAAGVTLKTEHIVVWRQALNTYYRSLQLDDQERHLLPRADVVLNSFHELTEELLADFARLEPYGNGNPEPVLCVQPVTIEGRRVMGNAGQHVSYVFRDDQGNTLCCNAWNASERFTAEIGETVAIWLELTLNDWRGRRSVEGKLLRIEPTDEG